LDFVTLKYTPGGSPVWVQRYDRPRHRDDTPAGISVDHQGNVFVAGTANGSYSDYATLKYSAGGTLLWERLLDGPRGRQDSVSALGVDANGNAL
jgi:hypothetical protein